MVYYKVVCKKKEATSAIGSDMERFYTASELWSYNENEAKLYSKKEAEQIAHELSECDQNGLFNFYIKGRIS